jgi:hypothetical protein
MDMYMNTYVFMFVYTDVCVGVGVCWNTYMHKCAHTHIGVAAQERWLR